MSAGRLVPVVGSVGFALLLAACGGGGDSAAGPTQPAGSLSVGSCTIVEGATTCSATVSWTTMNATSPRVLFGSTTLATTASGSATIPIGAGTQAVTLLDGATQLDSRSVVGTCIAASAWDGTACRVFAVRTVERAPTSFVESGRTVTLEVVIYKPLRPGPHPAVMFNHGSTGNGDDPAQFRITYTNEAIARFFADRGWLVAFPQRRGRGASDGLYDEGFTPDRSRYSCLAVPALAGFERALLDVDAAAEYLAAHDDVDATRMLSAGTSRGGVLAVVHAAERPDLFDGAVNFVGGWLGQGCQDSVLAHSRANFDAFIAAGGTGSFRIYTRAPSLNGHFIVNDPSLWTDDLDTFVRSIGGG